MPLEQRCPLDDPEQPVGADRLTLPLEDERRGLLRIDRPAYEPVGLLADQDLAGLGGLLEPCRDVDGVAGDERSWVAVTTSPVLTPVRAASVTPGALELLVQRLRARRAAHGGAHRAQASSSWTTGTRRPPSPRRR